MSSEQEQYKIAYCDNTVEPLFLPTIHEVLIPLKGKCIIAPDSTAPATKVETINSLQLLTAGGSLYDFVTPVSNLYESPKYIFFQDKSLLILIMI